VFETIGFDGGPTIDARREPPGIDGLRALVDY
jgi:hypothetical protein